MIDLSADIALHQTMLCGGLDWLVNSLQDPDFTYGTLKYYIRQFHSYKMDDWIGIEKVREVVDEILKFDWTSLPSDVAAEIRDKNWSPVTQWPKVHYIPMSKVDREYLLDLLRPLQISLGCVQPPMPRSGPPLPPPIRRNRRLSPILGTVLVITISVLGSLYGRDIVNWITDDSPIPELLEPILPAGGAQEGNPNSEGVCGNNIVEAGEACDGSAAGECRDGCTFACTCAEPLSSDAPVGNTCGNGVCDIGESLESCSDDCDISDLCGENGGVQWQGDVCVCEGLVDQVTICQDGTKIDNVTDAACTPDPEQCRTDGAAGGNGGSGDDGGGGTCTCTYQDVTPPGNMVQIFGWVDCNGNACSP